MRLTPTRILVIYLSLLSLVASFSWGGGDLSFWLTQVLHLALLFIPSYLLYKGFVKIGLSRKTPLDHKLITTLILFLLFDPLIPWFIFLFLGLMSELVQRLIRFPSGPIFNPAAAATALIALFQFLPGWWGVSFAPRVSVLGGSISLAMLFIPIALYIAYKYHKLPLIIATFIAYGSAYFALYLRSPLFILIEGTIAFFIIVMAVEPKTSPIKSVQQVIFGTAVGIGSVLLLKIGFLVPNVGSLLLANGVYTLSRNSQWLKKKFFAPTAPQNPPLTPQN